MLEVCAAGIPNASEFARPRVHLPRSKAAKKPGARVTGSLAFSSGARQRLRRKLAARAGPSFSDILDPFRYSPPRTLR
jgi:hypothetical protein